MNHTEVGIIKARINTASFIKHLNMAKASNSNFVKWHILTRIWRGCFDIRHPLQVFLADTRWLDKIKRK